MFSRRGGLPQDADYLSGAELSVLTSAELTRRPAALAPMIAAYAAETERLRRPGRRRQIEVPVVSVVRFQAGKLAHEHIYWDQASVLVQIGKLDPASLPVAGAKTVRKVLNKALPSNALMRNWASSEGQPRSRMTSSFDRDYA